jgi:hypothetical protein
VLATSQPAFDSLGIVVEQAASRAVSDGFGSLPGLARNWIWLVGGIFGVAGATTPPSLFPTLVSTLVPHLLGQKPFEQGDEVVANLAILPSFLAAIRLMTPIALPLARAFFRAFSMLLPSHWGCVVGS